MLKRFAVLVLMLVMQGLLAQGYPTKPVRLINPYAAGGRRFASASSWRRRFYATIAARRVL
jgi:hypothetical protein